MPDVPRPSLTPELAVQVFTCLDDLSFGDLDGDDVRRDIVEGLREAHPNADIRTTCVEGTELVGVWLDRLDRGELGDHFVAMDGARHERLGELDLLRGDEAFAFRITRGFVRGIARREWEDIPKRLDRDGDPDEDGPVRLRYQRVDFPGPDLVTTTIGAQYRAIKFRIRVEDTLSLGGGRQSLPVCETDVKVRTRAVSWGLRFVRGVLWLLFPDRSMDVSGEAEEHGAGCQMVQELPDQFLIDAESKLELSYQRLRITADEHLDAGATMRIVGREPDVALQGPSQVPLMTPQGTYTARTSDLRPPITFRWTVNGSAVETEEVDETVHEASVWFERDVSQAQSVRVEAVGADGVGASAGMDVRVAGGGDDGRDGGGDPDRRPPRQPLAPDPGAGAQRR